MTKEGVMPRSETIHPTLLPIVFAHWRTILNDGTFKSLAENERVEFKAVQVGGDLGSHVVDNKSLTNSRDALEKGAV